MDITGRTIDPDRGEWSEGGMKCMICKTKIDDGNVCSSCLEEARNPPNGTPVPEKAVTHEIEYNPAEWKLVSNNMMVHAIGVSFRIETSGEDLQAIVVNVQEPDKTLSDDVDALQKLAVRAYWRAVGFGKTVLELKPN